MSSETLQTLQGYGFFVLLVFMVVVLYYYWFYLHKQQKKGERDYEKYGRLALDDSLHDEVLENATRRER